MRPHRRPAANFLKRKGWTGSAERSRATKDLHGAIARASKTRGPEPSRPTRREYVRSEVGRVDLRGDRQGATFDPRASQPACRCFSVTSSLFGEFQRLLLV